MSPLYAAALMIIIGFVIGLLSVAGFFWVRAFLRPKETLASNEEARDLAMRVVLLLDDFAGACYSASTDLPEIDDDDPSTYFLHSDDPALVLPKDANWALFRRELADEIRWLPNRLRNVVDALESIDISPPEFNDLFEHRQDDFAQLGLKAMDIIEKLCAEYDLPLPERPSYYQPREHMAAKVRQMDEFWRRRVESVRQVPAEPSNISPIFGRGGPDSK
jgi:hypothetical protein